MPEEHPKIIIRAKTRVKKYAPGADPQADEPFEVVEHEHVLTGEEAKKFLEEK